MSALGIVTAAPLSLINANQSLNFSGQEAVNRSYINMNSLCSEFNESVREINMNKSAGKPANSSNSMESSDSGREVDGSNAMEHVGSPSPALINYIPPGLTCELDDGSHLVVQALGHFTVGHIWGPYLLHLNQECRQRLKAWDEKCSSLTLKLAVKNAGIISDGNTILLGEEHNWIRILHETKSYMPDRKPNVDLIIDPMSKTITLIVTQDIAIMDVLLGTLHIRSAIQCSNSSSVSINGLRSELIRSNITLSHPTTSPSVLSPSDSVSTVGCGSSSSFGPKRDKKCSYCGIPFSNLDTLTAHMTHYCSRRPLASTSTQSNQDMVPCLVDQSIPPSSRSATSSISTSRPTNMTLSRPGTSNKRFVNQSECTFSRSTYMSASTDSIQTTMSSSQTDRPVGLTDPSYPNQTYIDQSMTMALLNSLGHINTMAVEQGFKPNVLLPYLIQMASLSSKSSPNENTLSASQTPLLNRPEVSPLECVLENSIHLDHTSSGSEQTTLSETSSNLTPLTSATHIDSNDPCPIPIYCRGCQRYFNSTHLYISHIRMSAGLKEEETKQSNVRLSELVTTVSKLGLTIAAPLITTSGIVYIPVNPDCGKLFANSLLCGEKTSETETDNNQNKVNQNPQGHRRASQSALDLSCSFTKLVQPNLTQSVQTDKKSDLIDKTISPHRMKTHQSSSTGLTDLFKRLAPINHHQQNIPSSLAQLIPQLYLASLCSTESSNSSTTPNAPPNSSVGTPSVAYEAALCLVKLLHQTETKPTNSDGVDIRIPTSECSQSKINLDLFPNPTNPHSSTPQRPFLCPFCQTRFQAFTTFQAHQEFYCQARRDCIQKSVIAQASPQMHTDVVSVSPTSDHSSTSTVKVSSKRKRNQTLGVNESTQVGGRISSTASSASASGDEGDGVHLLNSLNSNSSSRSKLTERSDNKLESDKTGTYSWTQTNSSEFRCSGCGYVGQTARGMKMHKRLHECNENTLFGENRSSKKRRTKTGNISPHHTELDATMVMPSESDKEETGASRKAVDLVKSEPS